MVEHYKWKLPSLAIPRIVLDILQNAKAEQRRPAIGQNTSRVWYSLCDRLALSKFWIYVQNGVESAEGRSNFEASIGFQEADSIHFCKCTIIAGKSFPS